MLWVCLGIVPASLVACRMRSKFLLFTFSIVVRVRDVVVCGTHTKEIEREALRHGLQSHRALTSKFFRVHAERIFPRYCDSQHLPHTFCAVCGTLSKQVTAS